MPRWPSEAVLPDGVRLLELGWERHTAYCTFTVHPQFEHLLWDERVLTLYCSEGVRLDPDVLSAAFLMAMAPLGWTMGASISCGPLSVPDTAIACLDRVGEQLRRHYGWPDFDPFGEVSIRPSRLEYPRSSRGLLWSGGIDSAFALMNHEREIDWLVHLTNFENLESRMSDEQLDAELAATRQTAETRGLGWMHLRTPLPGVFKHNRFDDRFPPDCSFWLGLEHVQHLATALAVIRPLLAGVIVSGGYNELVRRVGSCAADAAFIDLYRYPAPLTLVDELVPRQRKIEALLERAPELLRTLRVCYSSGDGTCANCNKCQTTALMIVAAGGALDATSFPDAMTEALLTRIGIVRGAPRDEHRSFRQALDGRALTGSEEQRWSQLERIIARR
jgi:hypothetical protein